MKTLKKGVYTIILFTLIFIISCSSDDNNENPQFTFPDNATIFLDTQEKLNAFGALGHTIFDEVIVIGTSNSLNTSITNLNALSTLTSVKGLTIHYNNALTTLQGLSNLQTIGEGDLIIEENPSLSDIGGLIGLETIGGTAIIIMNGIIANLDGLNNLSSIGVDLTIIDNPLLTDFCGIRPILVSDGFTGIYTVSGNAINPTFQDIIDMNCDW